jgi:hypothetical protein
MRLVPDRQRHHRRSIRLQGYDYSWSGAYYVTLCTQDRVCLFGEVADGRMHVNPSGSDSPPLGAVLFGTPLDTPSACGGVIHWGRKDGVGHVAYITRPVPYH